MCLSPKAAPHSPRRCCLSQQASRISCSSWYLMAREAFPSSSRGRRDRFTLAWVQFEAKHVSRSSCRLWNCGNGIGAVCVSNERKGQNLSDPAPCWAGVCVDPGVNPLSLHCLHPSALPGQGVPPGGMERQEPGYAGWPNLTVANLSAGCPVPLQGKGSAGDVDVTEGTRTLPSPHTHGLHSGPPGEDAEIGPRAIPQ